MSKDKRKRSVAEIMAIKRYYAEKAEEERAAEPSDRPLVTVTIKDHHDSRGGHPHIIVDDIDNNHVSVGLTHDKKKGKNHPNYPMEKKPLGGNEQSFARRQGTVAPKKEYSKTARKGKVTPKDYEKVKDIGEKAKRKYIDKSHKKR